MEHGSPEANNNDIMHHTYWWAQPCKHCGPRAFLLGSAVTQCTVSKTKRIRACVSAQTTAMLGTLSKQGIVV